MDSRVQKLEARGIYFGTSSWKYPGWKGLIYHEPYTSEKDFNEKCLSEYAGHYPAVGVDHTYYAWPTPATFEKYVSQVPSDFRFGLKVTEKITVFKYPNLKRYGKDAGTTNSLFLSAAALREHFLEPLRPFQKHLGPLMLEFSQFYPGTIGSGREFTERLDRFFSDLGEDHGFQFAIELRNRNWMQKPYFDVLERHQVAHVINSWTRMPTVTEQLELLGETRLPCLVARLLLQPGTKYEEAVEAFSPYDRVQEEQPELRKGAAALVRRALERGIPAHVFVNNRAEGCAPKTIEGVLELLGEVAN